MTKIVDGLSTNIPKLVNAILGIKIPGDPEKANAKIGIIQAQKIDIEDKDIVIGMLQTLSTKDILSGFNSIYPPEMVKEIEQLTRALRDLKDQ